MTIMSKYLHDEKFEVPLTMSSKYLHDEKFVHDVLWSKGPVNSPKKLDKLWALRDFVALREAGCVRNAAAVWELWDLESIPGTRVLIWSSSNRP